MGSHGFTASKFQFTPLREGRRCFAASRSGRSYFNSRPSARGDPDRRTASCHRSHFNSRPSARGDRSRADALLTLGRDFNSRPSARGDRPAPSADQHHQPFQFTPLREGRRGCPHDAQRGLDFNSRPSARGDSGSADALITWHLISIHAPPRGATRRTRHQSASL